MNSGAVNKSGSIASKEEESTDPEMKIDTSIFKDHIKQKFRALVSSLGSDNPDSKLIIMDQSLFDLFRQQFTKDEIGAKIRFLSKDIRTDSKHLLILTPPSVQNMRILGEVVRNNIDKNFYLIFLPRRTFVCKEALQDEGIYSSITSFHDFNFDLIPLDYDLLSLEIPDAARQLYLELDTTTLILIAESIQRLQLVFGKFDTIYGKGLSLKTITDTLKSLENESKIKVDETQRGEIEALVIFDRNIDYVTPMLTQYTYAGHMDEIWGIKQNNLIMLDKKFFPLTSTLPKDKDSVPHKLQFDKVFKEIRDCHISVVSSVLDEKLGEIKTIHDEVAASGNKEKSLKEMREKYEKERKLREKDYDKVATHVEVRKFIDELMTKPSHYKKIKTEQFIVDGLSKPQDTIDFLETQILKQADISKVLRLLCLQSLVDGNIKQVALDTIKRNIIQAYGFEHLLNLANLEKAKLLKTDGDKKYWDNLNKQLRLINAELNNLKEPEDASFAYEGYCPIMVRLVEQIFRKDGWGAIKSSLEAIPGPTIYDERKINSYNNPQNKHVILVYVIGGVTYSELAGMRYLAKKYNKEILVATTGVITGDRFISSFYENINQQPEEPQQSV